MKNKILGVLLAIVLISIYPFWLYFSHAQVFGKALLNHASHMGKWSHSSISTGLSGNITLSNVSLIPNGYNQGLEIQNIKIKVDPLFLLKTSAEKLAYLLPQTMTLSVNGVNLDYKATDIYEALQNQSMWMLQAGYAGSFGCTREGYTSFESKEFMDIVSTDQIFNVDLYYFRQQNGSIDADLILDAENLFSTTWSTNLKSSFNDTNINLEDLLVDKFYYSYLDNGYNLKRNNVCAKNYKASFAAYRLNSAENVQKYMRSYFSKELPSMLIQWYQRMLAPDVEINAIITLNAKKYLSDFYSSFQDEIYKGALVEIETSQNNYLPVTLKDIDFTKIDTESLKKENEKKKQLERVKALASKKITQEKTRPTVFTTGISKKRFVATKNIKSAIGKKVRIKTVRGRPIIGYINSVIKGHLELESTFSTGKSVLTIPVNMVASVELVN